MALEQLAARAVAHAVGLGAEHAEARGSHVEDEWLEVRNGEVTRNSHRVRRGVQVRAFVGGAWGWAATSLGTEDAVIAAAERAVAAARAAALTRSAPLVLAAAAPQRGRYRTELRRDPFSVSLAEKLDLLQQAAAGARGHVEVVAGRAGSVSLKRNSWLVRSDGTQVEQEVVLCGGLVAATASDGADVQTRSSPKSWEGDVRQAGWEFVESLDLVGEGPKMSEAARELLKAPVCPAGKFDLVIDGSQLSLQIHESVGHPTEADRAIGEEVSLAGGSFLRPEHVGRAFGDARVNLVADSVTPGGLGTFGWDDEGTPAGRWDLVRDGRFVGYLGSRETQGSTAGAVAGAVRSEAFDGLPIVRMVNVNLEPGDQSLDQLIGGVEDGLLLVNNASWSIDDFRLNFQFSCEAGWRIRGGKVAELVKNPLYTGKTPEFWAACDGVGDASTWRMWGWMFCGKGDPMQVMHVGHGTPAARFRQIDVRPSSG